MSDRLVEELITLCGRGVETPLGEDRFNELALQVFEHQYLRCEPYQAVCRLRGAVPGRVTHWTEVPAVLTDLFKWEELRTAAPEEIRAEYRTSGTGHGEERRGRVLLPSAALYDASLEPNFRAHLLPDRETMRILVLGPTTRFFPQSSLGHMFSRVLERFGAAGSGVFWREDGPRFGCLVSALRKAEEEGTPVCLLGTAFGFVHFLDYLASEGVSFALPAGSRLMDTGGYKGRSREVPKEDLYEGYVRTLGIPLSHVVNEYGMTELASQFYDQCLRRGEECPAVERWKLPPPWCRVLLCDPESLEPLPRDHAGPGLIRFFDLANLHTVSSIQTEDLGIRRGDGFEILGRLPGAEARGCSLTAEAFLGSGRAS